MTLQEIDYSKFTDVQFINRGQFGMVHKAKYQGKLYAIKVQSIETKRDETNPKFKGYETHLRMAELKHENIVQVVFTTQYKSDPNSSTESLVMEFADFCLYDVLHKYKHLIYSPELGMLWALQIVRALEYLHAKATPIIHRDMKSPNLLLFGDGRLLKIADFGHATDMHTVMTNCAGTVQWMAPEIIKSKNYNQTCDVYSFSIILWEILARQEPYSGERFKQMMVPKFIYEVYTNDIRPDLIDGVPKVLMDIIVNCWSVDPSARPSSSCLVTIFEQICHYCKLVKPLQNKDGDYLEQTDLPESLLAFVDKSMSSVPHVQYHNIPELMSFPNLLPPKPDSSQRSKDIFNNHMMYANSYAQSNSLLKRYLAEEIEVDRELLHEEELIKQGSKPYIEFNRQITEMQKKRFGLYNDIYKNTTVRY